MLQQTPLDTFNYMVLAYAVTLGTIAALVVSLVVRFRNLARDLQMLMDLEAKREG